MKQEELNLQNNYIVTNKRMNYILSNTETKID